jgi:hypothetical protein
VSAESAGTFTGTLPAAGLRQGGDRPGTLQVDARERDFAERVVIDVNRIARTECGRALLGGIHRSGRSVLIIPPDRTQPPNAAVVPQDEPAPPGASDARHAGPGPGSDCLVAYDPADWPCPAMPDSPRSDEMLFALLTHAQSVLAGAADRSLYARGEVPTIEHAACARYRREREGD